MATAGAEAPAGVDTVSAWGMASARGITVVGARGITVVGDTRAITVVGDTRVITGDMEDMEATVTAPRMGIHPRFIFNGRKHRVSRNLPIIGTIAGIRKGTTPT
ncbi:hypothetical protein SAMN05216299_10580 [Nitrosospira sp. Nsp14]|uniref:hypothetical protein n=1 Tax=Nitrosospira sp. Nsp14 TaxID=1855333 RepID=UPI0008E48173|nr:hypothetical protein [Nitrosospira sp. Nsp14]SFH28709.1 hypothetical protein SAMN05216299_10580 [Nitrosospira sp. Nsp14]